MRKYQKRSSGFEYMNNVNIVIMGKTGAGKSTLVNAVMEADVAPTGTGQAITLKNKVYSRTMLLKLDSPSHYRQVNQTIHLYDTVGLELDHSITRKTVQEIKGYIEKAQNESKGRDINVVWFCVNHKSNRFEPYEVQLIKELANRYEIPFIVVITQCFSDEKGDLEKQIEIDLPEISTMRILAKDYKTRAGVFPAFGLNELLRHSVSDHNKLKVRILESKLEHLLDRHKERVAQIKARADRCIQKHAQAAQNIGWFPGGCIPFVHGICIKMLYDLDSAVGIHTTKGFGAEIVSNVIVGIIATPFMGIPVLSSIVAQAYVQSVGENYRDALIAVIEKSTDSELANIELVSKRIREELSRKIKK